MNVKEFDLSINPFIDDYLRYNEKAVSFFDYSLKDEQVFNKRLQDIQSRSYKRKELLTYFQDVYSDIENNHVAMKQIEKLQNEQSVVIVGGQQAGLLTGPLYTVYKAMSIVALAKKQEQQLGIAVIPIFWIAGEDHDLDEIRFVYKQHHLNWKKHLYDDVSTYTSASNVPLNQEIMQRWLDEVFATLPETAYTCTLYKKVSNYLQQSDSFVDFFRLLMHWLFADQGLLLLDAHDPFIRQLEKEYFKDLIFHVEAVQEAQQLGERLFQQSGYGKPIGTESLNAHLF